MTLGLIGLRSENIETNNFAFEVKVILGLESTIPEGRPDGRTACRPDGEAGNRTSYSPVGAGTGAELGNTHDWNNDKPYEC